MGLTSALYTGLSGLNANQFRIDTIGDNVANVNTTAFKASRSVFQTQFSQTFSAGSPPSTTSGGTNPTQIGLGSVLGSIQRSFTPGSIETTGVPTDLAIEGNGFFVVDTASGDRFFTRDGTFKLSASNFLVTQDGALVKGYGTDENFNIISGTLTNLEIPLGTLSAARATTTAKFVGNLSPTLTNPDAVSNVGTKGTLLYSAPLYLDAAATTPIAADGSDLLTDLYDQDGNKLFEVGDVLATTSSLQRGGRTVPAASFTVTATSSLADYLTFLTGKIAIDGTGTPVNNPGWTISDGSTIDPAAPGYDLLVDLGNGVPDPADVPPAGTIIIEGNIGTENRLSIGRNGITSTGAVVSPFAFTIPVDRLSANWDADGQSASTTATVYDSLGTEVRLNLTAVLIDTSDNGDTWEFFTWSEHDTDLSRVLSNGTITFDADGQFKSVVGNQIVVNRQNTGAVNPLGLTLDFTQMTGLTDNQGNQELKLKEADGFGAGSLSSYSVGPDGRIVGSFTNGLTRTLGQIALAVFSNPEGLVSGTNNTFQAGPNAGVAIITTPETLGAGKILSGSLELSNVDLSREFIGLITASTGFSAASRVISTSNDLLNELLAVAR